MGLVAGWVERDKEGRETFVWFGFDCYLVVLFCWTVLACVVVRIFSPNRFFYLSAGPVEKAMRREDIYDHTPQNSLTKQDNKTTRQQDNNKDRPKQNKAKTRE